MGRSGYGEEMDIGYKSQAYPEIALRRGTGPIFSYHYQGAGNIGECLAFGRIAAEHAVAEETWS
jgi:hypothetical protein